MQKELKVAQKAASSVTDTLLDIDALARELEQKAKNEGLNEGEVTVESGHDLAGQSLSDLKAFSKITCWRLEQLHSGARLFAYGYCEKYTDLSAGENAPAFVDHLRSRADDELLDVVKFSLSKFAEVCETTTKSKEFLGSVSEHSAAVNQQSLEAVNSIKEMSSGLTGLGASIRTEQEAAHHHRGASVKFLREASWHISGQGHNQTKTSIKELLILSTKLQERAEKHLGEHTALLKEIVESSKCQETWLEKVSKARPEIKASPLSNPVLAKPVAAASSVPRHHTLGIETIQLGRLRWHHLRDRRPVIQR